MFSFVVIGQTWSRGTISRGQYLTIRLWARDFYRVIVDEGAARVNYRA